MNICSIIINTFTWQRSMKWHCCYKHDIWLNKVLNNAMAWTLCTEDLCRHRQHLLRQSLNLLYINISTKVWAYRKVWHFIWPAMRRITRNTYISRQMRFKKKTNEITYTHRLNHDFNVWMGVLYKMPYNKE